MSATRLLIPLLAATWIAATALGQTASSGRLTLFGSYQSARFDDGRQRDFSDITAALTYRSALAGEGNGVDYALDVRETAYPSVAGRASRTRLYDAWAGGRMAGGRLSLRAGQMWLPDLGAIGSVGGVAAEYRTRGSTRGRLRLGVFGGAEANPFDAGYVRGVRKGGAWIAFDGQGMRRHVLGFVMSRNSGLTERSVLTTTNFIPVGKRVFVYQLAEYDLQGPGGRGKSGLTYFFANARFTPSQRVELMATAHRGRAIDARRITEDILNGRPVDQKALDGFLFESAGGRVYVSVVKNLRVHAGYASDRHNRDDRSYGRISAGLWAGNIAGSGFDLTLSDNRSDRPDGKTDAWYASIGRSFGGKVYVTADYATSLAIIRVLNGDTVIERRPTSKRYGISSLWNTSRSFSILASYELIEDDSATEDRATLGLVYRF